MNKREEIIRLWFDMWLQKKSGVTTDFCQIV